MRSAIGNFPIAISSGTLSDTGPTQWAKVLLPFFSLVREKVGPQGLQCGPRRSLLLHYCYYFTKDFFPCFNRIIF